MVIYNIYSRSSMCVLFPKYFMFARKFHPSHRIPSFFKNYLGNGDSYAPLCVTID